jgi:hypothetical protein
MGGHPVAVGDRVECTLPHHTDRRGRVTAVHSDEGYGGATLWTIEVQPAKGPAFKGNPEFYRLQGSTWRTASR